MKKVIVTALVLGLGLALAGCSTATPEEQYVQKVQQQVVGAKTNSARELVSVGTAICRALEAGNSEDDLVVAASETGLTARELRVLVKAAHDYLCPEVRTEGS